jgi:phosphomannomutase
MMNDSEELSPRPSPSKPLTSYTCPGEPYSISHSIHLARLAAFYSKCQDCDHRFDAEHIFPRENERHPHLEQRVIRTSLLTDESVRGVYLNELDRNRAIAWGEAFASVLWDQQPMLARRELEAETQIVKEQAATPVLNLSQGPTVVVGFDERPSSPDIVSGVVLGLRRMGCPVIDLGQTSLPIVAHHLQMREASAGLFVTGAGGDPSLTGFEFLARGALPFPGEILLQFEINAKNGVSRQTRQIGRYTPIQGQSSYESSLAPHFHALRPLKIACGSSTRLTPRILDRLFSKLPCQLTHIPLPVRNRNLSDPRDVDLQRVAKLVVDNQAHLGILIDEDCQHVALITDRGRLVTPKEIARILLEIALRDHHDAVLIVAASLVRDATKWLEGRDAKVIDGGDTIENLVRSLVEQQAILAIADDGRVWFDHKHPTCDALRVLARILQALSLGDAPFSEVVSRIDQMGAGRTD